MDILTFPPLKFKYSIGKNTVERNLINLQQLVFEVTDKCNLKCKYCAYGEMYDSTGNFNRETKNLSYEKAVQIIDN